LEILLFGQGVYNYTKLGYTKMRAPEAVFKLARDFWDKNKDKQVPEYWGPGYVSTISSHVCSPTTDYKTKTCTSFSVTSH
jgi:hypothetical protein